MKAIVTAAGLGTRFAPVTKVVPKEMLPIGAKPALELVVEEAFDAGADEVIAVISREKELIRRYFEGDERISFVYQEEQKGLGHAVLQARTDDDVLILLGDALIPGENVSRRLSEIYHKNGRCSVIGLERVDSKLVSRYGVVKPVWCGDDRQIVISDIVEKPPVDKAPSDIVVGGRYLLSGEIFDILEDLEPSLNGEIQLTDAIRVLIGKGVVRGYVYPSKRQDIGNPDGYYAALTAYRGL